MNNYKKVSKVRQWWWNMSPSEEKWWILSLFPFLQEEISAIFTGREQKFNYTLELERSRMLACVDGTDQLFRRLFVGKEVGMDTFSLSLWLNTKLFGWRVRFFSLRKSQCCKQTWEGTSWGNKGKTQNRACLQKSFRGSLIIKPKCEYLNSVHKLHSSVWGEVSLEGRCSAFHFQWVVTETRGQWQERKTGDTDGTWGVPCFPPPQAWPLRTKNGERGWDKVSSDLLWIIHTCPPLPSPYNSTEVSEPASWHR